MSEKVPFKQALSEWAGQRERSPREHPSLAELLSFHDRRLAGSELEDMRNHIAECSACARAVLEFSSREAESREDPLMAPDDLEASWKKLQARIAAGTDEAPPHEETRTEVAPTDSSPPEKSAQGKELGGERGEPTIGLTIIQILWSYRTVLLMAASLFFLGLSILLKVENTELSGPRMIASVHELQLGQSPTRGGETAQVRLRSSGEGDDLLVIGYYQERRFPEYMIEMLDQEGVRMVWSSPILPEPQNEDFYLSLPPGSLSPGRYLLRLHGLANDRRTLLSERELQVERSR